MKIKLSLILILLIVLTGCTYNENDDTPSEGSSNTFGDSDASLNTSDEVSNDNLTNDSSSEDSTSQFPESPSFIPDCTEKEYKISGNTQPNIRDGGYVAWQGNWVYYLISDDGWDGAPTCWEIHKENYKTGEKSIIFSTRNDNCRNLCVYKDYIFFLDDGTFASIKCDGSNYTTYNFTQEWAQIFYLFKGKIYYIDGKNISASSKAYSLNAYDIETQNIETILDITNKEFLGIEDGYAYLYGHSADYSKDYFYEYNLTEQRLNDYVATFNTDISPVLNHEIRGGINNLLAIYDRKIYSRKSYIDFDNQKVVAKEGNYFKVEWLKLGSGLGWNYINGQIVFSQTSKGLLTVSTEEYYKSDTYSYKINTDKTNSIFTDGSFIYYDTAYSPCRVKPDGTGFEFLVFEQ